MSAFHDRGARRDDDEPEPRNEVSAAVKDALSRLERDGRLTANDVVEAARDPRSPLHEHFEWDDDAAAEAWRIEQARRLIRTVRLVVITETETIAAPYYARDTGKDAGEQGYVALERVRKEPENAASLLRYEFGRAAAHCQRAVLIAEQIGYGDEAKKIAADLKRIIKKLEQ